MEKKKEPDGQTHAHFKRVLVNLFECLLFDWRLLPIFELTEVLF